MTGTADSGELRGPEDGGRRTAARDGSPEAVQRQIAAMGTARYKVMLVDVKNRKEQLREWRAAALLRSVLLAVSLFAESAAFPSLSE